jgi:hypothetical protein
MKTKILHITVAFLLLISTLGITINRHYCGNRFISASIFSKSCCSSSCHKCHNEVKQIRVSDAFVSSGSVQILTKIFVPIPILYHCNLLGYQNPIIKDQVNTDISPHPLLKSASLLQTFRL